MAINVENKTCFKCNKGLLRTASLQDDWSGILTCNNCGYVISKHIDTLTDLEIKRIEKRGYDAGIKDAKEQILNSLDNFVSDYKIEYED